MTRRRYTQAMNDALVEEMTRNPRLILFGEDINASYFGDTRGLVERFGSLRVRDTPISEAALTSMAAGAAMTGTPVVCHMMFSNFLYLGMDGIANQVSKMRVMSGGHMALPVTYIAAVGGGTSTGAQHSDTAYPMLMNLGGVNVVVPATPADAKGLLKSALRSQRPTFYLVPRVRGAVSGEVPESDELTPFGSASIVRPGSQVTVVAIGAMRSPATEAAELLAAEGVDVELIDPRSLVPLDIDAILESVRKTGRMVVVDEARDTCSAASHIAALVAERGFHLLKSGIVRVTTPDLALPYAPVLERALIPNRESIVRAVRAVVQGHDA